MKKTKILLAAIAAASMVAEVGAMRKSVWGRLTPGTSSAIGDPDVSDGFGATAPPQESSSFTRPAAVATASMVEEVDTTRESVRDGLTAGKPNAAESLPVVLVTPMPPPATLTPRAEAASAIGDPELSGGLVGSGETAPPRKDSSFTRPFCGAPRKREPLTRVPSEGQLALERLAAALVEYRIQRDQARSERDQTAEQLAGFEHERDEAEAQRGQTQEAYDRIARELNAHKTRITTLNAENDDLRNLSERYQQDIQILQAQLDELRRERSDLREQLNGTQANIGQDQSDIDTALRLLISVSTRRSTGGQPVPPAWPTNLPFDTENDDPLITGVRLLRLENTQLKQANERQAEQLHATKDELQTYINRTGEIEQATKALEAATSRETADRRIRRHMVAHYLNPNDRSQLLVDIAEMSQQEPELADACRQAEQDVQQTSPNRRPPSTKQPTKKRR